MTDYYYEYRLNKLKCRKQMFNLSDEIEIKFYCPECNTILEHDYTNHDIFSKDKLTFTCQKCGHIGAIKTTTVIDEATKKAIKVLGG